MDERIGKSRVVGLEEAAALLDLSPEAVRSLVGAGYLSAADEQERFTLGDLKAFVARNADDGSGVLLDEEGEGPDPQALLEALDGRSEEMARRAYDVFCTAYPDATNWTMSEQARFVEQARKRFEAILAVTGQGREVDLALVDDLREVGASAAWTGSSLPQLLVILRISRDLVVQTAVQVTEEHGRHWGLALSLLLTRVLPAIDRLTDAVAQGYWAAILRREEESRARYEAVVEDSSDGVFEIDLDGRIRYANRSFAVIVGRSPEELDEALLFDVLVPLERADVLQQLVTAANNGASRGDGTERPTLLAVKRADGVRRLVEVHTHARRQGDDVVSLQGVVRDVTTAWDLEEAKNEFLALITHDLRRPLTMILGQGANLETHAVELSPEQIARVGASIRHQSERIARLADDLHDVSRLEARSLALHLRAVNVADAIEAALPAVASYTPGVEVKVPPDVTVLADPRRLEQVLANLIENAIVHGAPPVIVEAALDSRGMVDVSIRDHGPGVPDPMVHNLFSRVRSFARRDHQRGRGTGLGLALVRGLVEAMGGRAWYEAASGGGACFHVALPSPPSRSRR
jgi:PAS domain S-box-containing protein